MSYAVHLRVHSHGQSGVSVFETCIGIGYASWQAVVALSEDAAIADCNGANLGGRIFGPAGEMGSDYEESLVPMFRCLGWLEVVHAAT
jgi:hypothetical protein